MSFRSLAYPAASHIEQQQTCALAWADRSAGARDAQDSQWYGKPAGQQRSHVSPAKQGNAL
jgi:hypothetical protein